MKKYPIGIFVCCLIFILDSDSHAMRVGAFEIHPFLSLTERYTDNVFNTRTDEKSDFSTVITPGVQIIFPRVKRRYQLEVIYQTDLERFNKFTSENVDNHKAVGKFEIKFPVGLELNVNEQFKRNHDPRGVNISPELDFYKENLFSTDVTYSLTDRFRLQLDYSNYVVDYEAERNNFRDRTDNTVAAYIFYRFMLKTSAFIEYEYVVVDFRESSAFDSKEHHFFGGITWDVTEKTKGKVKGGYGIKDFEDPSLKGFKGYLMEVGIDHNFTSRHSIKITGTRKTNETNTFGSDFFVTTGFLVEYFQRFTGKITAKGDIAYGKDSYHGEISRRDTTWKAGIGLIYQIKKLLRTEAGYSYTKRDSNFDDFNYRNNTYFLKVIGTL